MPRDYLSSAEIQRIKTSCKGSFASKDLQLTFHSQFKMTKLIVAVFATCLAMAVAQPWHYAKYCDDPETPDHGGFKPDRKVHALKDRVDFYCKNRYRLIGAKSAVCTYDRKTGKIGWSNPSPKCVGELRSRLLQQAGY